MANDGGGKVTTLSNLINSALVAGIIRGVATEYIICNPVIFKRIKRRERHEHRRRMIQRCGRKK